MKKGYFYLISVLLVWLIVISFLLYFNRSEAPEAKESDQVHKENSVHPIILSYSNSSINSISSDGYYVSKDVSPVKGITPRNSGEVIQKVNEATNYRDKTTRKETFSGTKKSKQASDYHLSQPLSWRKFISLAEEGFSEQRTFPVKEVPEMFLCPADVFEELSKPLPEADLKWCQWALSPSGGRVQVGSSYGKLNSNDRNKYEQLNCNAVAKGKNPSCEDAWGDNQITSWRKNLAPELCGDKSYTSDVVCRDSPNKARICTFKNVMLDFSKMHNMRKGNGQESRLWDKGFLGTHCDSTNHPDINYYDFYKPIVDPKQSKCSYVINETVLVYGHDDSKNLGHSMSDFMNVWTMLWLTGLGSYSKDIVFLNMDAIRLGHNYNDDLGNLAKHYELQFKSVLKATDFAQKKETLCIKNLIVQPQPVILFTWDGWWQDMRCSFVGPSSIFQRWNVQVRDMYGVLSVPSSFPTKTRILLIKRSASANIASKTMRVIVNLDEIEKALNHLPDVIVQIADLAKMPLDKQVKLAAQSDIIIGTHGAGITHSMHMPIGTSKKCCGVIEIFPVGEFMPIKGHGNMARRMGTYYERLELSGTESQSSGAVVPPKKLLNIVSNLVQKIDKRASCVLPKVMSDPFFDSV